ncbi:MAG: SulP family inorganic anion transporter, partial [Thermomicrobiales bacterium]|nr:SulP family inorganic anion transporter [Thermomicrobiales bacterium]
IAGVDPKIGLYASFSIAVIIAFAGGRPGMISAATGAMALLMVDLVKDHGLQYLFAAAILTGLIQMAAGLAGISKLMRFVSNSVMTGFVNALAILIFLAQLPELIDVSWITYPMVLAGLAIIYGLPRITTIVPSPLICILLLTIVSLTFDLDVRRVGDMGELPDALPVFLIPDVPFNLETLRILLPYAIPMAIVGLLESLMTASIIDDFTDTNSNSRRESTGQGIANVATGFLGGMAGCAMIGQSVINVKSGGRGRLSTLTAGVLLLILVVVLGDWVGKMPMPALVAVMIMVSIGTFNWRSIANLRIYPWTSSAVMLATVAVVVATHNLAYGVVVGVLFSGIFFAWKIGQLFSVTSTITEDGRHRTYVVDGQVFFASRDWFVQSFDFQEGLETVTIDVHRAHFWDISAIAALDKVVLKFRRDGATVAIKGMNQPSSQMVDLLAVHDKSDALDYVPGH